MKKLKISFFVILLFASVFLLLTSGTAFAGTLIIGGVITGGILGGFSGKVGNVVGGKWKTTDWMRVWVKPRNPQSTDQTIQRTKMSTAVAVARNLLSDLINVYWDPFYTTMSGYNKFLQENISLFTSPLYYLTAAHVMAKGNLTSLELLTATYSTASGEITASFSSGSAGSGGLSTDNVFIVVMDKTGKKYYCQDGTVFRADGGWLDTIDTGLTAADLFVYIFAYRGSDETFTVSNSDGLVCSAA